MLSRVLTLPDVGFIGSLRPGPDISASLTGWYDSSDPSLFTLQAGNKISQWNDKSNAGNNLTQAVDASRPVYEAGVGVRCGDGNVGTWVQGGAISGFITNNAFTIYSVIRPSECRNSALMNGEGWLGDAAGYFALQQRFVNPDVMFGLYNYDGASDFIDVAGFTDDNGLDLATTLLHCGRHAGGSIFTSVNGGSETSVASGNTVQLTDVLRLGTGRANILPASRYEGHILEVLIYNDGLAHPQTVQYLKSKWGIP